MYPTFSQSLLEHNPRMLIPVMEKPHKPDKNPTVPEPNMVGPAFLLITFLAVLSMRTRK